jgi:hypothetical protein
MRGIGEDGNAALETDREGGSSVRHLSFDMRRCLLRIVNDLSRGGTPIELRAKQLSTEW